MAFELLSEPIRKYIREKRWEQLRPIQAAAIERIMSTEDNYILASRTASGKTEAAFLPILSKVNFKEGGVKVLYISPLISLINDQFYRIEDLCKDLNVTVTKWHGEAKKSDKDKLLKQPEGVVLITPESLEAMFVNKPYHIRQLFSNLQYVVIDEIHSFIGSDRGTQLKSLLYRLQKANVATFKIIGLSATIGDYTEAKKFTGDETNTKVLLDRSGKDVAASFRYFENKKIDLPLELLKDLYMETKDHKALIFPNSRGRAEEIAVKLKKISDRVNGHGHYFSHHSSVDKEVREYIEHFAKNNTRYNFSIVCTSTLELGIDIGTVDEVIQIDTTHSIASLIQRIGRSGRREGEQSKLVLYATHPWSLLQSLSCWLLYQEGFIEPPEISEKPYDILLHQALSITKGHSGMPIKDLMNQLKDNFAFSSIDPSEIEEIVNHLITIDFLEKLQSDVIIGVEGEKIVNSRDFYSVFKTEENFKVLSGSNKIGEIPISPQVRDGENILLAAQVWKITYIDFDAKKIEVIKAFDGKKPMFFGSGSITHTRIREKMFEVLCTDTLYDVLEQGGQTQIDILRREFSKFNIKNRSCERPLLISQQHAELFTFSGTKVNRAISFLLNLNGTENIIEDNASTIEIDLKKSHVPENWSDCTKSLENIDMHLEQLLCDMPALLDFSKWGQYLPMRYQVELLKHKYFDFKGADHLLNEMKVLKNKNSDDSYKL
jgi:ATP-dependent Lhr-like helicase